MSCVMASRACPDAVVVVRGNQPLTLRYCERLGVVAWASEAEFLDVALGWLADWEPVLVPSGSIAVFSALSLPRFDSLELRFNRACA